MRASDETSYGHSKQIHIDILGMCNWMFVDMGGLMDGTKEHPEKGRSIGQGIMS